MLVNFLTLALPPKHLKYPIKVKSAYERSGPSGRSLSQFIPVCPLIIPVSKLFPNSGAACAGNFHYKSSIQKVPKEMNGGNQKMLLCCVQKYGNTGGGGKGSLQ